MPRRVWVRDPDSGGGPIPKAVQERIAQRIQAYAKAHFTGKYIRLDVRFKKQFCYIDAYTEPEVPKRWPPLGLPDSHETRAEHIERLRNIPTHLCRLRYFGGPVRAAIWSIQRLLP